MTTVHVWDPRRCRLGEGPAYDAVNDRVSWVDTLGKRVLWRTGDSGAGDSGASDAGDSGAGDSGGRGEFDTPGHVGAALPRAGGGYVLCLPRGPVLLDADGTTHALGTYAEADAAAGLPPSAGAPAVRSNDAKPDPAGRLWLGTMAYDRTAGVGALYRLDPGADVPVRVYGGVSVSNGLGWSPDGTRMYYVDSPTGRVDVMDYDVASGTAANRRQLLSIPVGAGFPDGLCVDAAGGVWVALWEGGAVRRYLPDGSLDRELVVGTPRVTSCAFAGPELDWLVITTARVRDGESPGGGMTYRHRPGDVVGSPVPPFAG
jgi:sugar lactone lactonase YvrE